MNEGREYNEHILYILLYIKKDKMNEQIYSTYLHLCVMKTIITMMMMMMMMMMMIYSDGWWL